MHVLKKQPIRYIQRRVLMILLHMLASYCVTILSTGWLLLSMAIAQETTKLANQNSH